jgi:outer membrane murein-binding lipoprotein Lpp
MNERYHCVTARRRERLLGSALNGIDYLEVAAGQARLDVTFVKDAGVAGLDKTMLRLTGGVRYHAPAIAAVAVSAADPATLEVTLGPGQATDFSTYRLALVAPTGGVPAGFDPESASVDFSFKINCPSPFDCADSGPIDAGAEQPPDPDLDYTARDWRGFRQLMLDRMSVLLPGYDGEQPVDQLATHAETLAYVADHLSYRLDAVANDTDLFRARSRIALARHARLVDYPVHEGCNARLFVRFEYAGPDGASLPAATALTIATAMRGTVISPDDFAAVAQFEPLTFETMHALALFKGNNRLAFHTWSGERCTLARGATAATLRRVFAPGEPEGKLAPGDFLILAETASPITGSPADADRRKRHAVRLTTVETARDLVEKADVFQVGWDRADALPFDLVISAAFTAPGAATQTIDCAEAWGNVALADHGLTLPVRGLTTSAGAQLAPRLEPPAPPASGRWRPRLTRGPVVRAAALDLAPGARVPASRCLQDDPAAALPTLTLHDGFKPWSARRDLLASERFERHFVVETEYDGAVSLRFGDDVMGLRPVPGDRFTVTVRIGRHADGNVGAGVLRQVVTTTAGIIAVSNPLPAAGGTAGIAPARVRIEAPYAFRVQERAVTEADYGEMALRHPGVASARATVRWTGSWRTAFVYVDRVGGGKVEGDAAFREELAAHMERYRLCGIDVVLKDALAVPLDLTLSVCVQPGALRAAVRRGLLDLLGSGTMADGRPGYFHPDNFTFGTPLYVSQLIAAVMTVPGVASAQVTALGRRGKPDPAVLAGGVIAPFEFEILRLDNDPNFPENGLLTLDIKGGK